MTEARLPLHLLTRLLWRDRDLLALVTEPVQPAPALTPTSLKLGDQVLLLQRQCDVVKTVEEAMAAEGVDLERDRRLAIWPADLFLLQVNLELKSGGGVLGQSAAFLLGQRDGKHAVLHRVVAEDVGKAGRDDRANTEVLPACSRQQCNQ